MSTSSSSSKKLVRALYKSLLGSARLLDAQPATKAVFFRGLINTGDLDDLDGESAETKKEDQLMDQWYTQAMGSPEARFYNPQIVNLPLADVVRHNFKANAQLTDPESVDMLTGVHFHSLQCEIIEITEVHHC